MERKITPTGLNVIQIGFFSTQRNCWSLGQLYEHVEIRFSDFKVTSISKDPGIVYCIPNKRLSNPKYTCFFELAIELSVEREMQILMEDYMDSKIPFSTFAMYWNFIPITRNYPMNGLFCSHYICKLLQISSIGLYLNPLKTTPDDIFYALQKDKRVVCSFNPLTF